MISNSGHDERGKYSGGVAGDQTGGEWRIQDWYKRPWICVLRYPEKEAADTIAALAEEAARNNRIGYDQNQRTTFWKELQAVGYHPANITTPCEADCSAGVAAIVKATGYLLNIPELKKVSADMYTGNERRLLVDAGFSCYTDKNITDSPDYLRRGDILLYDGHHTAINLTDGAKVQNVVWRWVRSGGDWFYQDQYGNNTHGWLLIKETKGQYWHWYWFDSAGRMATGATWVDDKLRLFMPSGDLMGAMCISDTSGYQHVWNIIKDSQ